MKGITDTDKDHAGLRIAVLSFCSTDIAQPGQLLNFDFVLVRRNSVCFKLLDQNNRNFLLQKNRQAAQKPRL